MKVGKKTTKTSGQAIIEYVLLLAIILSFAGALKYAVTQNRDKFWKTMVCEVSAPCAGCTAPASAQSFLPNSGAKCKK
jgi:hypothetical protein